MALRLILMRHAKSDWDSPWQDDHARGLNARGQRSAEVLGDWLRREGHVPDAAISSDATRTRETFAGLALDCPVRFTPALYLADAGTMLDELRQARGATVLMIGHNPGIAEFARQLVSAAPDHPRFADCPTGATLVAEFPAAWNEITFGTGTAVDFTVPRDLM
ncbi:MULTISPECIES: SixA phosphatase family protein [unclassified Marinovum]